ncbi:MAG: hypothetical protein ACR2JH_03375 [Solirubrobacteraceae bacterium]
MLLALGPADAHEGDPNVDPVILGVRPVLPGVEVDVVQNIVAAAFSRSAAQAACRRPSGLFRIAVVTRQ